MKIKKESSLNTLLDLSYLFLSQHLCMSTLQGQSIFR